MKPALSVGHPCEEVLILRPAGRDHEMFALHDRPDRGRGDGPLAGQNTTSERPEVAAGAVLSIPIAWKHAGIESHDAGMDVELLVIPGCPGREAAAALLRRGLDDIGLAGTPFAVRIIDSDEAARARRFAGSPAFVVDGVDLFDNDTEGGALACRVYPTADGHRNVPDLGTLRRALKERAASAAGG